MRLILAVIMLSAALLARADIEIEFDDGSMGVVSDGRVLFGDDKTSVLYVVGQEHFTIIDWNDRTVMNLTPGFAEEMMAGVKAQMDEMLASVPAAQREMIEQQMKSRMPQMQAPRITTVRKTGSSDEVAGFDCDEAEIIFDDDSVQSVVCIATADELGFSDADFDAMTSAMKAMAEMAAMATNVTMEDDFQKLGGIPIRSRDTIYGHDNALLSVKTSGVDVSRLQIPDDFKEISLEDMMR